MNRLPATALPTLPAATPMTGTPLAAMLLAAVMLAATAPPARADEAPAEAPAEVAGEAPLRGELRLHRDTHANNPQGPLAAAHALVPAIAAPAPDSSTAELGLRGTLRAGRLALLADGVAWQQRPEGGTASGGSGEGGGGRVNELHLSAERGAWGFSAGKKVLGWDVGYGFRPNDLVQQEQRRTLYATPLEGRPLLEAEHFGAQDAATLVWVNPQRLHDAAEATRNAGESALAGRWYRRSGALDSHGFARLGAHTGASLGAALAWVAGDALELHASARLLQRHDGWRAQGTAAPTAPATTAPLNPWQNSTRGGTSQWLLGGQWTGAWQQSLLVEAWHDGTALPDAEWRAWQQRSQALAAAAPNTGTGTGTLPAITRAGALAWQATPFNAPNLRQDNLFVRLAWQPERWTASVDLLLQPQDRGVITTAALQWQGDRLRLNAAWRRYGGAADALVRQLPQRGLAVLGAAWAF